MITLKKIYRYLIKLFPLKYQEKWDKSGIIRNFDWDIKIDKILICLDCTKNIIRFAKTKNIKLVISHHPIFNKNNIIDESNIKLLKKLKISLISLHTNVDNHPLGLNYYLSNLLNFKNTFQVQMDDCGSLYVGNLKNKKNTHDTIKLICEKLNITHHVKYVGNNTIIERAIICSGAGFDVIKNALNYYDTRTILITGDIKWHDWLYADQLKLNLLDIGHDVEKHFIELIYKNLQKIFPCLKIYKSFPSISIKLY